MKLGGDILINRTQFSFILYNFDIINYHSFRRCINCIVEVTRFIKVYIRHLLTDPLNLLPVEFHKIFLFVLFFMKIVVWSLLTLIVFFIYIIDGISLNYRHMWANTVSKAIYFSYFLQSSGSENCSCRVWNHLAIWLSIYLVSIVWVN